MKKLTIIALLVLGTNIHAQSISKEYTIYLEYESGTISNQTNSFSVSNNYINKSGETYGPIILTESGQYKGYYFESYLEDIDKDPLGFLRKEIKAYQFTYDKKGGTLLRVSEIAGRRGRNTTKKYYTEAGHKIVFK